MADIDSVRNRLNVNLTVRAADELQELGQETGLSKTDLVCRSIDLYWYVTRELNHGCDLLIRDPGGDLMKVHIQ
jgi:hypothetical protein